MGCILSPAGGLPPPPSCLVPRVALQDASYMAGAEGFIKRCDGNHNRVLPNRRRPRYRFSSRVQLDGVELLGGDQVGVRPLRFRHFLGICGFCLCFPDNHYQIAHPALPHGPAQLRGAVVAKLLPPLGWPLL